MNKLNANDQSKQFGRFMDLNNEPLIMMAPIKGYDKMPLVSLEEAVKPLIPLIPEVEHMAYIAKKRSMKPPPDRLTEDQSAAIMLYTLEWEPKEESVYYKLNQSLRIEDRQALKPWFSYLKLFLGALSLLPSKPCTVYRGVKGDQNHRYKKGEKVIWWGFSSCTSTVDVLSNDSFLGSQGDRTMFTIECQNGKEIEKHSYFKREDEVLLPAAREFQVKSILQQGNGLCIIQLIETQPKYPLLETSATISQIVQKFPSSQSNTSKKVADSTVYVYTQPSQTSQYQPYVIPTNQSTQQGTLPIIYRNQPKVRSCSWYCGVGCGIVFCCPCTVCYLCYSKNKNKM